MESTGLAPETGDEVPPGILAGRGFAFGGRLITLLQINAPIRSDLACRAQLTPCAFPPRSLATAFKGKEGSGGQELELEEEHVAWKADALRHHHSRMPHMFGDSLRLSHRIRAFAAGPPRRHRRYVERVWGPA